MMTKPVIVGAGLAGLCAGHAWPSSPILEASPQPRQMHNALLRFRSDSVSRLTGIEFRKVRVQKGIWADGKFRSPDIQLANWYSQKVIGELVGDRSIWNLDPVDRFIAPETLYEQLLEATQSRIKWGCPAEFNSPGNVRPLISTAPLPLTLTATGIDTPLKFKKAPITVVRCRAKNCDVFQTVYFPNNGTPMYRASITGSLVTIEAIAFDADRKWLAEALDTVCFVFGLAQLDVIDVVEQSYGKIAAVADAARKQLLFRLTHEFNIYSLGRFAIWKNILLDDVVNDIDVLKRMLRSGAYENRKQLT